MSRRILLLITDLEIGGTPTVVRELAIRLNHPPDVVVEVACLSRWGPVADQLAEAGITVTALGAKSPTDARAIYRLIKLIRDHHIDTLFSFLFHANVAGAIAKMFARGMQILQSIQTTQPYPRWHWRLQSIVQEAAERIIVPSESVARVAGEWSGIPRGKIEVIPNALDVEAFCSTGFQPVRHGLKTRATVRIGFLGRLDPIKCVPDLIDAIAQLDQRYELHIFGDGAEHQRIKAKIDALNLRNRVTLHGEIAKPQAAMSEMDILVLPSKAEGFGLVLIEAMASGVPVIATDVPGIRDVVRNGETGLLVPVGKPAEIAGAIQRIANDDALWQRLIDAGVEEVKRRFTWETILPLYRKALRLRGIESLNDRIIE